MTAQTFAAERDPFRCEFCGFCETLVPCHRVLAGDTSACSGCGACALACPNEAIRMVESPRTRQVAIRVDGDRVSVPERITVKRALELLGYSFGSMPAEGDLFAPCGVGGCWSCAVLIDGELRQSCVTTVRERMEIMTRVPPSLPPRRSVHGWMGHAVGGVGTPWHLKSPAGFIEAAVFACGCNLRCPQCQNWRMAYSGVLPPLTAEEAATRMTLARRYYGVDRMAVSGGESTLNRSWLLSYVRHLKSMNPDGRARIHVDTNATILTEDYIDALVDAGMTDIGPDLKGLTAETFVRITGIGDPDLAERYRRMAWSAVEYLVRRYRDEVFVGVGIPYNPALISKDEVAAMGERLCRLDPGLQVCVLDYRPEFRRLDLVRPTRSRMREIREILHGTGLKTVLCQTASGYIGP
ncbi:MAG: radical SAM protein [Methanomicrobiales archaeon]|nr:radical SAM protein [Methanomicrobiales archaeon]MDI6877357.1 radical SAM protein [Methanomicrobiales archaeon]